MERAVGLSPDTGKRSRHQMHPEDPQHPKSPGSQWPRNRRQRQTPAPSPSGGCTMAPSSPASPAWLGLLSSSSSSRHRSARPSASCRSRWGSTGMSLEVLPPPGAGTARGDPPLRPPPRRPCSLTPIPGVLKPPAARTRRVTFQDEAVASGRPTESISSGKGREEPGPSSVPPGPAPWPQALPDYVVRYPVIRSSQQREGYKGVFQDQLWEYTDLLWEIRSTLPRELEASSTGKAPAAQWAHWGPAPSGQAPRAPGCVFAPQDGSRTAHVLHEYVRKKQRCEYLKQKLTHIKARIQEYDRDRAGTF
ncbi:occludin/ELL domain-containing protein 1 isoform X1 [Neopsephotus bourkii]|uniref:occludin/ELL domain-containing protein 1 isoform X1 n=1 Tax=Neopsephotus bourkii TaxID=309878 RepID=UPI002AA524A4|nr:occludin/ELL domain-containing protein 1 isoform X1 [Neopsephotus bourkii]